MSKSIRNSSELERNVFGYLNRLRASGSINMFGAIPVIEKAFKLSESQADELFWLWTKNFNKEGKYDEIEVS